ncbi:MAG: putative LPS assembly protein LptD [Bacteroidota bacterium]
MKHYNHINIIVFSLFISLLINFQAKSQVLEQDSTKISVDSVKISKPIVIPKKDTLNPSGPTPLDSILAKIPVDTLAADSVKKPVGDIKTTVHYKSMDSITLNMTTQDVKMFGEATIDYTPISISAEEVTVNWKENLMRAEGKVDTTGRKYGTPVFKNGDETYETDEIRYNFKTEKAAITGLVTTQGDGFIHADKVFKNAKGELFNATTLYTTCNLAHPHYSIKARKVKVIPGKEMISGPFNMILHDVPLPVGFAFGIFPDQQHRSSGIIFPTYGEETRRGFYLRQGGYYFALSDYINLELTGDIYTKGGWAVRASSAYNKRYHYRGNFQFNFTKLKTEIESTLETTESNDFRLSWSHSPQSRGTGRFSANVDMASSSYSDNNMLATREDQSRTNLSSSVRYSKTFKGTPFSMALSARFSQNLKTKIADVLLPDFSLNMQNIYPFKGKGGSSNKWYQKIALRYSMNATNKITNHIDNDTLEITPENLPMMVNQGSNGVKHNIPISTSLSLFKHFKVNPSFNYDEIWYFKQLDYHFNEELNRAVADTIDGFNAIRMYRGGVGVSSMVYGTVFFDREFGVKAIRHQMIPSLSFSYKPDFSDPKYNYFQEVQSDTLGNTKVYSRHAGFVYGQAQRGESGSIGLSISNTLEMKYLSKKDTTGKAEKVVLLRNFGLNTSYNMLADSFNLSNISFSAATNLLNNKPIGKGATTNGFNINFRGSIDPYLWVLDSISYDTRGEEVINQRKLNQFAFNNGKGLGQFSTFNVSISTGFQAKRRGGSSQSQGGRSPGGRDGGFDAGLENGLENVETASIKEEQELREIMDNPDLYLDFNIPWSLRLSYNVNYSRQGYKEGKVTQSLRFNGDISLTQKWKATFSSGYDFERKKFNEARVGITRDLHCWEMRLDWVPYGRYQSYNFTIRAKSSLLQDLKLSKRRNATDSFNF